MVVYEVHAHYANNRVVYYEVPRKRGTVEGNRDGREARLGNIKVPEIEERGNGMGTMLLFLFATWATEHNLSPIRGSLWSPDGSADSWYPKRGFKILGRENGDNLYAETADVLRICGQLMASYGTTYTFVSGI